MKKIKIIFFFALIFFCNFSQLFSQENTTSAYDFSMEEVIDEQDEQSEKKDTKKTEKLDYENIASPETQDYQIAPTEYSSFNPNVSLLKINDINTTYNRNVYKFTSYFLLEILSPPLIFYKKNVPDTIHTGLKNFFRNMDELSNAMNHILQADPVDAGISIARFAINSTVGILGFIDVSEMIGLSRQSTSMDETLESWYIPPGPFIMLPLLGGGTLRSYTGMVIDSIADPFYWLVLPPVIPDLGWRAVFSVSKSVVNG
ncbi:MAG: VacJ family lipoprotein, partial [Rickettsiales bacterium]|nr:VacJ family lipoprotein [Rickettsiales bacterium]